MWSLSAFTSVGVQPIVYCRAVGIGSHQLTWRQAQNSDLFNWPAKVPVRRMADAWDRSLKVRGGLTYLRFRERVRQIAAEALSYLKEVIVVHDFQTLVRILEGFEKYVVIPVDDDDIFNPELGSVLRNPAHPHRDRTTAVAWPNLCWWSRFDGTNRLCESLRSQPSKKVGVKAVGSNSYGFTERALREWGVERFRELLDNHWKVSDRLTEEDFLILPNSFLSLEIKHVGCTSWLTQHAGNDYWWTEDTDLSELPLWATEHCDKVRELSTQLLTDMGKTFDHDRLISEASCRGEKHE